MLAAAGHEEKSPGEEVMLYLLFSKAYWTIAQ
jgi:hypothetical protein